MTSNDCDCPDDMKRTIRDLEEALLDYVLRYGPTDKARKAIEQVERTRSR